MKKAFITGITGQDGSYLAEFLLTKGYEVHGLKRRSSSFNTSRIDHIYQNSLEDRTFHLHYGDLSDTLSLIRIIEEVEPDEIYNLGAQSHVGVSFQHPEYTAEVNALGALRLLEAMRFLGTAKKTKFYQASSSELFGKVLETPQKETTPFNPQSPYAIAKLFAYWMTVHYRDTYGVFACNGILFNHESPRRGGTFVTSKVVDALCNQARRNGSILLLGNLDAARDWGHAADYVKAQWAILQAESPGDYVVSTGTSATVREFAEKVSQELGFSIAWEGSGKEEKGFVAKINCPEKCPDLREGQCIIKVDARYFRPAEVDSLLGDATKANEELGWKPIITIDELVKDMVASNLEV